jgi:hypothetical protein
MKLYLKKLVPVIIELPAGKVPIKQHYSFLLLLRLEVAFNLFRFHFIPSQIFFIPESTSRSGLISYHNHNYFLTKQFGENDESV